MNKGILEMEGECADGDCGWGSRCGGCRVTSTAWEADRRGSAKLCWVADRDKGPFS